MKKNLKIIIIGAIIAIIIIGLIIALSFRKNLNTETGVLQDNYNGLQIKFNYPKNSGYDIENGNEQSEYQYLTLTNNEKDFQIRFSFEETYENIVESEKIRSENDENYKDFEEVEYSQFKGYSVTQLIEKIGENKEIKLLLKEKENEVSNIKKYYVLSIIIEKRDSESEINVNEFYKTDECQNILKSIQFTDNFKGIVKYDGVLSSDHSWGIKTIKSTDESKYKVSQYRNSAWIITEYIKADDENENAHIQIVSIKGKNLEKAMNDNIYYKKGLQYDTIFYNGVEFHDIKNVTKINRYADNISHVGYFEKDGQVWQYEYHRTTGTDEELQKQLLEAVVDNIEIVEK